MKNILAENMLRFRSKGITESMLKRYLIEQEVRGLSVQEIEKRVNADRNNKSILQDAQSIGQCVFIKSPKVEPVTLEDYKINAHFWNNMVSLKQGLMPDTPMPQIQQQINTIIEELKLKKLTNLQIQIVGTATTAKAYDKPDPRLLKTNPGLKLDHPGGKPYAGQEPNNPYLAQQRAESIKSIFAKLLPTAKFTTSSEVVEGGFEDDASRYILVKITGDQTTADKVTLNDIWMNWTVSYEAVTGTSVGQRSQFVSGGAAAGYKAKLLITYGQKNVPVFTGKVYFESAQYQHKNGEEIIADPKLATRLSYPYLLKGAGSTNNPNFSTFLASCGYFETNTAYDIAASNDLQNRKNSIYRVDSDIFKKMAEQKTGNLQDFLRLAGGSDKQIIDAAHAKGAKIYDVTVTPPTLTRV